ncbi:hypothetical protein GCM10010233_64220 [Streptomyces pseudogriseolus]|uniref:Uncharacterized protein n=1 Tax=Streptomyces pseudogriseolus TaxID=36817 RepID=A0ABQ2TA18_STREZ|nr:hypothetical protein GCM10010233_64220 [Streptomyces gancidicus]GGS56236.1 hypothetical protein GCM10010285_39680 [Streptomyces rubiginosus]
MAVGEDDGDGLEPVLADRLRHTVGGLVARVDDHALLTGGGGDEITVRPPCPGGEPGNEHDRPSFVSVREACDGAAPVVRAYRRCRFLSEPIYGTGHTQAVGSPHARVPAGTRDA